MHSVAVMCSYKIAQMKSENLVVRITVLKFQCRVLSSMFGCIVIIRYCFISNERPIELPDLMGHRAQNIQTQAGDIFVGTCIYYILTVRVLLLVTQV